MIPIIKSFLKSQQNTPIFKLLFTTVKMLLISEKVACSVEYRDLNLYYSLAKMQLVFKWLRILAHISFSLTFEKELSKDIGLYLFTS